jgi:TRAP-type C4-dicarboxylate transport system permease small subunit
MLKTVRILCRASSLAAGISLVCIAGIVLAQIGTRLFGASVPSSDDFAAWTMAATVFLALPSAFLHGRHISVFLAIDLLPARARRMAMRLINLLALLVMATACWFVGFFVWESYVYQDMSQGVFAVPLWIPQSLMVLGLVLCLPVLAWISVSGAPIPDASKSEAAA